VSSLTAILVFGLLMSFIALSGSLTLLLNEETLERLLPHLIALAAGTLIGGALFHMLPSAVEKGGNHITVYLWVALGFVGFLFLEQLTRRFQHRHDTHDHREPISYLILIGDGLHNFIAGLSIGALFISDFQLGLTAWAAAAVHEVPQEIGDFGVIVHSGWKPRWALTFNLLSGLAFLIGGLVAYAASQRFGVRFLVPIGAGNFLYLGAADLIPEFKGKASERPNFVDSFLLLLGMGILLAARFINPN
jgi:zinc and cadmium transporter